MGDISGKRRDHEREPFSDATGMDARTVERHATPLTSGLQVGNVALARVEIAERRHDILSRIEDTNDLFSIRHDG